MGQCENFNLGWLENIIIIGIVEFVFYVVYCISYSTEKWIAQIQFNCTINCRCIKRFFNLEYIQSSSYIISKNFMLNKLYINLSNERPFCEITTIGSHQFKTPSQMFLSARLPSLDKQNHFCFCFPKRQDKGAKGLFLVTWD